jgi:hypothetical protein
MSGRGVPPPGSGGWGGEACLAQAGRARDDGYSTSLPVEELVRARYKSAKWVRRVDLWMRTLWGTRSEGDTVIRLTLLRRTGSRGGLTVRCSSFWWIFVCR